LVDGTQYGSRNRPDRLGRRRHGKWSAIAVDNFSTVGRYGNRAHITHRPLVRQKLLIPNLQINRAPNQCATKPGKQKQQKPAAPARRNNNTVLLLTSHGSHPTTT